MGLHVQFRLIKGAYIRVTYCAIYWIDNLAKIRQLSFDKVF